MKFSCTIYIVFFLVFSCGFSQANAQFQTVFIGVNGLTCSQCSRTVEISIRKLDFVSDVQMNLEHTEGKISIKKGKKADMGKIAQAVVDAGFSLRYLQADLTLDNSVNTAEPCFKYLGDEYVFIEAPKRPLTGTVHLKFIGKKFLPKNEFKKMQPFMINKCTNTVPGNIYYISI